MIMYDCASEKKKSLYKQRCMTDGRIPKWKQDISTAKDQTRKKNLEWGKNYLECQQEEERAK